MKIFTKPTKRRPYKAHTLTFHKDLRIISNRIIGAYCDMEDMGYEEHEIIYAILSIIRHVNAFAPLIPKGYKDSKVKFKKAFKNFKHGDDD